MRWSNWHDIKLAEETIMQVRIPKSDIFARDRAYMQILPRTTEYLLGFYSVRVGNIRKSCSGIGFRFPSIGQVLSVDISDIIAAVAGRYDDGPQEASITIELRNADGEIVAVQGVNEQINFVDDGYSPLLDFIPSSAIKNTNVLLTPPTRMLYADGITPSVAFLLNGVFPSNMGTYSWRFNGEDVTLPVCMSVQDFSEHIEDMSQYTLQVVRTSEQTIETPVYTLTRHPQLADECRERVLVSWRTPWGVEVEHLFYLGTYNGAKANAKQVDDTLGGYMSVSDMIRSGSFYLDAITDEYDLWYYKSMMRADWVRVQTQLQGDLLALMPMPAYNSYYNVRITGCSVGDIIADGINSKVLQFEFERED